MLFHNVYAMSSTANTPTRPARGMPVPGIDTRGPAGKAPASLPFSGWPLTPPQSAHESRRPSLAYSALSDASHSGPSSISGYSQPTTPVHNMNHHNDFTQQWSDGNDVHASMSAGLADTCSQAPQQTFASAFQQLSMCNGNVPNGLPTYVPNGSDNVGAFGMEMSSGSPMRDAWSQPQQMSTGFNGQAGLRATLFQSTQGLGQDQTPTTSMYANPSHSAHASLGASAFPNYDTAGSSLSTSVYQSPQVVVPSQLSPQEDYSMESYPGYDQQEVEDGYTQSFDSSGSGYSGWESVEPQSPEEMYFGKTEDDGFVLVKNEPLTPTNGSRRTRGFFESGPSSLRPKRRGSKRGRKSHAEGKVWYQADVCNMDFRCEGPRFSRYVGADGQYQYKSEGHRESKPHKCMFRDEDGKVCEAGFERSEHLKRHMSKHSKERPYPCPLDDCTKKIARPDNAADHFRTHLRQPTKGKRNKFCTFEDLELAINREYSPKIATKLLNNLRKWMETEREKMAIAEREKRDKVEREMLERDMFERDEALKAAHGHLYH